ncbi:MAG: hypothetical protein ABIP94_04610, partial [Planctomycetota bacterium]
AGIDTGGAFPGGVFSLASLPNGLIAAGAFVSAGGVNANNVARWNGTSWSSLGAGTPARTDALAVLPTGDLVAGGVFANGIARWNGTSWFGLGAGIFGHVHALAVLPTGELAVGGEFADAGGAGASNVALWNGTTWSSLHPGTNGDIHAVLSLPNGDLIAGGVFTYIAGVPANRIARWDGSAWSPLGSGVSYLFPGGSVDALATLPNGDLVAGGNFTTAGGISANRIARGWQHVVAVRHWHIRLRSGRLGQSAALFAERGSDRRWQLHHGGGSKREPHRAMEWQRVVGARRGCERHLRASPRQAAERRRRRRRGLHQRRWRQRAVRGPLERQRVGIARCRSQLRCERIDDSA